MSGSLNKVTIIGNLGSEPQFRTLPGGGRVAVLSVATNESWKDKESGEKVEKAEWHSVNIFNEGIIGIVEKHLHKGSKVYLEGSLETRKWTDSDSIERYSTEIVLRPFNGELKMLDAPRPDPGPANEASRPGPRKVPAQHKKPAA